MKGAPLRFAAAVVGGWAMGRFAVLWPTPLPIAVAGVPPAAAARRMDEPEQLVMRNIDGRPSRGLGSVPAPQPVSRIGTIANSVALSLSSPADEAVGSRSDTVMDIAPRTAIAGVRTASDVLSQSSPSPSRLSVDAWLVARPGGGDNLAFGQLGASQGGARLTYALDRRVALSGRVSAPLRGTGREIGVGLDLTPTRLPLHLLIEQRIDLDTGSTRPAVIVIAGISTSLPRQLRLDAYAQAGAVRRRGGFIDGAAMVTRPILTRANTRLEVGTGTWGASQRGAARLDVGPSIALVTPGAGGTLRLQLDYRARIAGHARPGSGPALTLGGSF